MPKVIDYILYKDDPDRRKREGIELVELDPGAWYDINMDIKGTDNKIHRCEFRYNTSVNCVELNMTLRKKYYLDKPLENLDELRLFLKHSNFKPEHIEKIFEYMYKASDKSPKTF